MSLGNGSITFSELQKPSGAPFASTAAKNGLSVSTGAGNTPAGVIQLGNLLGDPLNQALLLDIMEIPMNGQQIRFTNHGGGSGFTVIINQNLQIFDDDGPTGNASILEPGIITLDNSTFATLPAIRMNDLTNGKSINLNNLFIGGLPQFTIDIDGQLQTWTKDQLTITGAFKTVDPGAGAGVWKLGTKHAGAVALDGANYIEVMIDGTLFKLGIVV